MTHKVAELRNQRAKLVHDARQILERAEREKRELTPEEQAQWDAIMAEVDALRLRIERIERQLAAEEEAGAAGGIDAVADDEGRSARHGRENRIVAPHDVRSSDSRARECRETFWRLMRGERIPNSELRALGITTPEGGGYTVPNEFEAMLIKRLEDENVMRQLATVGQSASGDREIPVEVDIGEATYLGEAEEYQESDIVFGQVRLGAHKLGRIIRVSEELLNDSAINIEEEIASAFQRSFGRAEERAMVNGDGVGKPTGVVMQSTHGADAAANAITADNIIDLVHGLRRPYRRNAVFLMHDSTVRAVRKLKTADDQYIWQPGLQAGEPDRLLDYPLYVSPNMPEIGSGNRSVLFGDFRYYRILDRTGITMQRLVELYAARGQVGFRMMMRNDGKLTMGEAIVHLLHG